MQSIRKYFKNIKYTLQKNLLRLNTKSKNYKNWVYNFDNFNGDCRLKIEKIISSWQKMPLISIIMPVYQAKENWLKDSIGSIQSQVYSNWELCVADDNSGNNNIKLLLEKYARNDKRIKVVFRKENGGISDASNTAAQLATGEWLAFLDQDDLLHPTALFYVISAIMAHPNAGIIYSDEDKISGNGYKRYSPYFKSDFNVHLFYSHNMICHLGVYKADIFKELNGLRKAYDGSQDYDLALRFLEKLDPKQIVHIPIILYHWRSHCNSTAKNIDSKPYARNAALRALGDHFIRKGIQAKVEIYDHGYRVRYELPKKPPLVSLIVLNNNNLPILKKFLESIFTKTCYPNYELFIVDNNSDDLETLSYINKVAQTHKNVHLLHDHTYPFNYSMLNNNAVKHIKGEYICFLNNHIDVITPEWLSEMVSIAIQPKVGAVGACLWHDDDTLQHAGIILGLGGIAGHKHAGLPKQKPSYLRLTNLIHSVSAVTGACMVVSKKVYEAVGGFDEENLKVAFNDVDFCIKVMEKGYHNVWTPYAELYNYGSQTRGYANTPEKIAKFNAECQYMKKRWGHILTKDPNYNPNLSLESADYSLAWPPRIEFI
ncbi:Glycosyl transferase, group 2 family protein [Liberibacter crescens BT-1]|uniref:Glycosyl transferase, group 2 family protein n=1 Tax=Liberibacter crescens (strain BT-1) TaxID=1215343 RepID=L0ETY8_LIBCB|nr:glycosyltransferase [Liberibacter crescens]AGA64994.1 Glycosyl transferase, group 2 family protein [Liberibacter crescens BT-1]